MDESDDVLEANSAALTSVMKSVPPEELVRHVEFSHNLINSLVSEARRKKGGVGDGEFLMPGFCRKKGLDALIPMYHHAVLNAGTRGIAAKGELVGWRRFHWFCADDNYLYYFDNQP